MSGTIHYQPGSIYQTSVSWGLANGAHLRQRDQLTVWAAADSGARDTRTGETVWLLLVTLSQSGDQPFQVHHRSAGWVTIDPRGADPAEGHLGGLVGVYVPNDPNSNSIGIMAEHYAERLVQLRGAR